MSSTVVLADAEGFAQAQSFARAQARRTEVTLAGYSGNEGTVRTGLADQDPTVRAAALSALERLGTLTSLDVAIALEDTNLRVRRRACELATITPVTSEASHQIDAILLRYLQTGDETMAELGAWSLGERHQQQSVDSQENPTGLAGPISAALRVPPGGSFPTGKPDWEPPGNGESSGQDPQQGAHSPAAENRTLPENQTLAEIVQALAETVYHHPDALVREASVAALGCIGTEDAKAPILYALADKATVRRRAVIALSAFEGDDVEAALAQASGDRDWQVRQAAEDLLS
jgi:HEAT repeat protein